MPGRRGYSREVIKNLIMLLYLLPCVSSSPLPSINETAYTSLEPNDLQKILKVRIAMLSCSGISITACLVAFFWFFQMEKQFRHQLIMLLLYGDITRATWYLVFAAVSLGQGTVKTNSSFCQASGFLMQYGETTSDYAVFAMTIHSALQVFHPFTKATSDGLEPCRFYVYTGALLVPCLMAGLAFVNPGAGYESLGAYCTLPIRPFWYRLALVWIPRYLITLIIIGLAIAIYSYVNLELGNIHQSIVASQRTQLSQMSRDESHTEAGTTINTMHQHPCQGGNSQVIMSTPSESSASNTHIDSSSQRPSLTPWAYTQAVRELIINPSAERAKDVGISLSTELSCCRFGPGNFMNGTRNDLRSHNPRLIRGRHDLSSNTIDSASRQNLRLRRQLRLVFIYPLVYTLMWLIPFAHHCTMYIERNAQHPLWFLRLGATICISSMGLIDCLVFFLRERPWQRIAASEGGFWRGPIAFKSQKSRRRGLGPSQDTWLRSGRKTLQLRLKIPRPSVMKKSHKSLRIRSRLHSNDCARVMAAHARVRLELERAERLTMQRGKEFVRHTRRHDDCGGSNSPIQF